MVRRILFVFIIFTGSVLAQIITPSKYPHEKLSWGLSLKKTQSMLSGKGMKRQDVDDKNPFMKGASDADIYVYEDRIDDERIGIGLVFTKKDSTLRSIMLSYFGFDSLTHEQYQDYETRQSKVIQLLTSHYPSAPDERSVPFMGSVLVWDIPHLIVQGQRTSKMFVLIMKPKE